MVIVNQTWVKLAETTQSPATQSTGWPLLYCMLQKGGKAKIIQRTSYLSNKL